MPSAARRFELRLHDDIADKGRPGRAGDAPFEIELLVVDSLSGRKTVLLVSAGKCADVEECLEHADCVVTRVRDGSTAIERAKHTSIDAAVLVSTGRSMERSETALNLIDINPGMQIIIVNRRKRSTVGPLQSDIVASAIPGIRVMKVGELVRYLAAEFGGIHRAR